MTTHRSEKDSMGAIDVPADKLWGAQTQRSLEHFRISTEKMPTSLIHALALTKRAAAKVNEDLGLLSEEKASAIRQAADEAPLFQRHDQAVNAGFRAQVERILHLVYAVAAVEVETEYEVGVLQ